MKRFAFTLVGAAALIVGCNNGNSDSLLNGQNGLSTGYNDPGGGPNGESHNQDPNGANQQVSFPVTDPAQVRTDDETAGSPDTLARLHTCGKISVAELKQFLTSRGVNMASTTTGSSGALYKLNVDALGSANYPARVPEASFASTSGMVSQMDIFASAAAEIVATGWAPSGCQETGGTPVALFDSTGAFTKDALSCLMGKPASDEHVALANAAVTQASTPTLGKQIAISKTIKHK